MKEGDEAMEEDGENPRPSSSEEKKKQRIKTKELRLSCMLNTEVGAILAVVRRAPESNLQIPSATLTADTPHSAIIHCMKSLRALLFNLQEEWQTVDPSIYLSPFLEVIQNDDVSAAATGVALTAVIKILKLQIFDENTPGAKDAINAVVTGITNCRLEKTDPISEDAILMRILQVLLGLVRHNASILLSDQSMCTVLNACFQVVQQSSSRDLLQRVAKYVMHELIQAIFSRLPDVRVCESDSDSSSGYGAQCATDIVFFLCSMLNVVTVVETETEVSDEDVQLFSLVLINSAIEFGGEAIGRHGKLLKIIQDDVFHHLIHYGARSSALVLSMICSTVLNIFHSLRRFMKLQLEAFFQHVLFRKAAQSTSVHLQEVAVEGIVNFCRQPEFLIEAYINYDSDPLCQNIFEEIMKLLCKHAFPSPNFPLNSLQIQAFEGLVSAIDALLELDIDPANTIGPIRNKKMQKRKMMIASNHFNRDMKKGLEYLSISNLADPKSISVFFRYTPGVDKSSIGDYLGEPDEFHLRVLNEFTATFDFTGMSLDTALRSYLQTFRLPGESQKIQRILEAFSDRFYEQKLSDVFINKDAVLILCYSLIMLNTDQHNPQVKKKMTEEEFIRNNRSINGGNDLPRDYLSELFTSIATNAIVLQSDSNSPLEMTQTRWIELMNRSKMENPYMSFDSDEHSSLGRDMFACIAGVSIATLSAIFDHAEDEDILRECVTALFAIAKIAQHGLEETLEEVLLSLCKFTTLLNPYTTVEETLYVFSNDVKVRTATIAVFAIANDYTYSIRGAWRYIVDCLLKLKRMKLLPQSIIHSASSTSETSIVFLNRMDQNTEEALGFPLEYEQNLEIISRCQIGSLLAKTSKLQEESLLNLGRSVIYAAGGKGQKFSAPGEEEDTIAFCFDLVTAIGLANIHRFLTYWPHYHDYFLAVAQFPLFSPIPFAEKAIISLLKICTKLLESFRHENLSEELIFKSINLMWKLDKEILDTCCVFISESVTSILTDHPENMQTPLGWKSTLHLLSIAGRHPETYDRSVDVLINLLSDGKHLSRTNYSYSIDCAFGFVALKNSPVDKNLKMLDLMADSVNFLVNWYKNACSESGSGFSYVSNTSSSSMEDNPRFQASNFTANLFLKLGDALRKTSLARREEIRNYAVSSLGRSFDLAEELCLTWTSCTSCFNLIIFAMVDDLQEKTLEYSRRENAEKEMRSMEGTLRLAMELLVRVFLQFLDLTSGNPGFRTFWLGVLRRMDTCMKADLGRHGHSKLRKIVPDLLRKMIVVMKEKQILARGGDEELWDITYVQIQWIAPPLKDELFPHEEL